MKNKYLIKGYNSLHLKTLHDGDIIDPLEYIAAIKKVCFGDFIYVVDESGKHRALKKESFLHCLRCYNESAIRCNFKKEKCGFYPLTEGIDIF